MFLKALHKILERQDLTFTESEAIFSDMLHGLLTPVQITAFLTALAGKHESPEEIAGAAAVMRTKSIQIRPKVKNLTDTCGTGGDNLKSFNISTTVAFVLAGGGVFVAKHGNRGISSSSGSADVLENLGIPLDVDPKKIEKAIEAIGIGFLFAPAFHPGMKFVMPIRTELKIRTIFNILGPLASPAGAEIQLIGVFEKELCEKIAWALQRIGVKKALIVHGDDGMDEITLTAKTYFARLTNRTVELGMIDPEDYGFQYCDPIELLGGNPAENAEILLKILENQDNGPRRDIVLLNAGAAFWINGKAKDLAAGIKCARRSLESGAALKKLQELRDFLQK